MLSVQAQSALCEFGQVDILLEMIVKHLVKNSEDMKNKEWFVKLENALHLLEATYRKKKKNLVIALEGGNIDEQ